MKPLAVLSNLAPACSALLLPALAFVGTARADEAAHLDLWITGAAGGALVTGGWDHKTGKVLALPARVFEGELGLDPEFPTSGDEPGIGSDLLGTTITMNLLAGLGVWNGDGFDATTAVLLASYGGQDAFSTSGGSFAFLVSEGLDLHPEYTLLGDGLALPANGIYLAAFTVAADGFTTSETFWIAFNLGMDEAAHGAATEWVESNLVPAPGALALLVAAGAARGRRRR